MQIEKQASETYLVKRPFAWWVHENQSQMLHMWRHNEKTVGWASWL